MKRLLMIMALLVLVACTPAATPTVPTPATVTSFSPAPCPTEALDQPTCPPLDVLHLIYDDDGSPDGTTALLYLLSHPGVDLEAVSLSFGEVYPEVYIQHLGRMLDDFGIIHFALGYGQKPEYSENIHFPESVREASSNFWGFPIPNPETTYQAYPSPELMVSVIRQSPQPVTLFVTGPCTNLAEALRLDPGIKGNIAAVYIMGGAVYVPGNVHDFYPEHENLVAEWNFVADPRAAQEVLQSGLDLYLVPLDATNQVFVTNQDTNQWRQGGEIADFAADIYDWLISIFGHGEAAIWDLMTAAIMLDHDLCGSTPLRIEALTEPGNSLGQSAVVSEGEPNISVCLEPDVDGIKQTLIEVFSNSR
ncbi:MAG: nucleoside hydrolase [Anaerolineales bacterium]|jgi:purine nucleosidase/pyrimidine-specific ribonucleoside hydrolase